MSSNIGPGDKVRCIDACPFVTTGGPSGLTVGGLYTIKDLYRSNDIVRWTGGLHKLTTPHCTIVEMGPKLLYALNRFRKEEPGQLQSLLAVDMNPADPASPQVLTPA